MRQGTTPTLTLTVVDADLSAYQNTVLIRQGDYLIKRENVTAEYADTVSTLAVTLTQQETLALKSGNLAHFQVRFVDEDGVAGATEVVGVQVNEILESVVIEYGV